MKMCKNCGSNICYKYTTPIDSTQVAGCCPSFLEGINGSCRVGTNIYINSFVLTAGQELNNFVTINDTNNTITIKHEGKDKVGLLLPSIEYL